MTRPSSLDLALVALLAAASIFVLPALDAALPGGVIAWQVVLLVIALGSAIGAVCAALCTAAAGRRRLARSLAGVALVVALAWGGGILFLWIIWPR